jgi:tRNA-binding protein
MGLISWEDFDKVEMHVGKVERVKDFSEARNPSYLLTIDFGGSMGLKRSSVAIRHLYSKDELLGKFIVAVTNFPPKQIANHMSEVLVLAGVNRDGSMRLLQPDAEVELGARVC